MNRRIARIRILVIEAPVGQIGDAGADDAVAMGQSVSQRGIHQEEAVVAGLEHAGREPAKFAALPDLGAAQRQAEARWMEIAYAQRKPIGLDVAEGKCHRVLVGKALVLVLGAQGYSRVGGPEEVGASALFLAVAAQYLIGGYVAEGIDLDIPEGNIQVAPSKLDTAEKCARKFLVDGYAVAA